MATSVKTIKVAVSVDKAMERVAAAVGDKMVSVIPIQVLGNRRCVIAVYEKYYARMGASSVATVVFDDTGEGVCISCVCAGTGSNFELGSNTHFQKAILASLKDVTGIE